MKILCSDYDGTLSHGGVDEKKLAAISAWRKKGNKFGIITGRRTSFYRELKELTPVCREYLNLANLEADFSKKTLAKAGELMEMVLLNLNLTGVL